MSQYIILLLLYYHLPAGTGRDPKNLSHVLFIFSSGGLVPCAWVLPVVSGLPSQFRSLLATIVVPCRGCPSGEEVLGSRCLSRLGFCAPELYSAVCSCALQVFYARLFWTQDCILMILVLLFYMGRQINDYYYFNLKSS